MSDQTTPIPAFDQAVSGVQYREVADFPGYVVGDDGSLWCCRSNYGGHFRQWRRRKCDKVGCKGAVIVRLNCSPREFKCSLHKIVMEAFVGPRPEGLEICHNNGDPADNRLCNLRYDTRANNAKDMQAHGTMIRGEQKRNAKLNDEQVRRIKQLLATGVMTMTQIARDHNVHLVTICHIRDGVVWRHVE